MNRSVARSALIEWTPCFRVPPAHTGSCLPQAGSDGSNLAGDPRCLFLSDVIHKAFVAVDEEGAEAAAATLQIAIPMSGSALPPVEFTVDWPFIFLIRDRATGTVLFIGRVLDPRA